MVNGKLVVENMSEDELNQAWDIMGHSLMQSFFGSPHPTSLRNDDKDKDKKKLQGRLGNKEAISAVWWGNSLVFIVAMMVGGLWWNYPKQPWA